MEPEEALICTLTLGVDALLRHPETALRILVTAGDRVELDRDTLDDLQEAMHALMESGALSDEMHDRWLAVCQREPMVAAEYAEMCIELIPGRPQWAEQAFSALLDTGDEEQIAAFLRAAHKRLHDQPSRRIGLCATFFGLLKQHLSKTGWDKARIPTTDDLLALKTAIAPESSSDRADMFVAAMQFLESRLNPHWLTPVAMEAEALCLARRFKEAHELASLHPDLRIGPKQQTIYELIDGSCKGCLLYTSPSPRDRS